MRLVIQNKQFKHFKQKIMIQIITALLDIALSFIIVGSTFFGGLWLLKKISGYEEPLDIDKWK